MSVRSCIDTLVGNAKITAQQGRDAKAIFDESLNDDLFRDMPQAGKEAMAALRTAKFLTEDARNQKLSVKLKVDAWRANTKRIGEHPVRPYAGHNALYGRDPAVGGKGEIHGRGGPNLEGVQRYYGGLLASKLREFTKAYEARAAGFKQDTHGIRNFVLERLGGVDTGDPVARAAAKGYGELSDLADKIAVELDPRFRLDPENKLPQHWESYRAVKFGATEHKADILKQAESGGLRIFDKETRAPAKDAADRDRIVNRAIQDIRMDLSSIGDATVMSDYSRTFRFANNEAGARSYLALMDKYGAGQGGYFASVQTHVNGLARELALKHQFGPDYRTATKHLFDYARKLDAQRLSEPRPRTADETLSRFVTGEVMARRLQQLATGELSNVENKMVKGIFDGASGLVTASHLGSALIASVPGDVWTATMAANRNGLNAGRLVSALMHHFAGLGKEEREKLAARLGVVSHAVSMDAIGTKRFGDQLFGEKLFKRFGDTVVRGQGLARWDGGMRLAFSMEFLATLGGNAGKAFADLDPRFARFLKDYGFTEAEWARISAAETIDTGLTKSLLPSSLDTPLRIKIMSAIADESQFANVSAGSMRTTAITSGGAKAGTIAGELNRARFLFLNYPVTMAITHVRRAAQEAGQGRFGTAASLIMGLSIAGAMTIQAKQILAGKDPRDMSEPSFWAGAFLQGGAASIYGDFIKAAFSRADTAFGETLLGPLAVIPLGAAHLLSSARREAVEGEKVNWGSAVAKFVRDFTPGSNLWYFRLLFDRYLVDTIKRELDPDYTRSFRREEERQKKLYGQEFFFPPGELVPARPPDLGAAGGI